MVALAATMAAVACGPAAALAPPTYKGISYGALAGEKGTLYVSAKSGSPIVVLVHGGGWRLQPNEIEQGSIANAIRNHGLTVFDINYEQDSPTTTAFPLEVEEVETAIGWIVAHAGAYNGDPANVELLGGSAGGQLVSMAADLLDAAAPGTVRAVISLSAPYDLRLLVEQAIRKEIKDLNYIKSIGQALGCSTSLLTCSSSFEAEWSPAFHLPGGGCPTWMIVSSVEDRPDTLQAEDMLAHLQQSGCTSIFDEVAKSHGFYLWSEVATRAYEFLKAN